MVTVGLNLTLKMVLWGRNRGKRCFGSKGTNPLVGIRTQHTRMVSCRCSPICVVNHHGGRQKCWCNKQNKVSAVGTDAQTARTSSFFIIVILTWCGVQKKWRDNEKWLAAATHCQTSTCHGSLFWRLVTFVPSPSHTHNRNIQ